MRQDRAADESSGADSLAIATYVITVFSVHACMCSALTSAILYRVLEALHDNEFEKWTSRPLNRMLLRLPMMKFGMGCVAFLVRVVLKSWQDLSGRSEGARAVALAVGLMSMSTVVMTVLMVTVGPSSAVGVAPKRVASGE